MSEPAERPTNVIVTDIRMPFGSMVVFMVKWAIAAIPALLILLVLWVLVVLIFGTMISRAIIGL